MIIQLYEEFIRPRKSPGHLGIADNKALLKASPNGPRTHFLNQLSHTILLRGNSRRRLIHTCTKKFHAATGHTYTIPTSVILFLRSKHNISTSRLPKVMESAVFTYMLRWIVVQIRFLPMPRYSHVMRLASLDFYT